MTQGERGESFRSGFVAIVGRPNVGKSTLLNRVIGQKVTIVSDKPQTTRNKIQCVWTTAETQVVFLDTPGIHRPHDRLGESMVKAALDALHEVDLILLVVDGHSGPGPGDRSVADRLANLDTPRFLVINKMDQVDASKSEAAVARFAALGSFARTYPISAQDGKGVDELLAGIQTQLPLGPRYYPDDWVVDQPEQFIVAELIREKALVHTRDELPHAIAVEVERMQPRVGQEIVEIDATIYVERDSQKGIVIGRGGSLLKRIGSEARRDIETLLGTPIFLQLWVKVDRKWREKERMLTLLGYR